MSDEKGALLAKGITGKAFMDSRGGHIKGFISALVFFIISIFFSVMFFLEMIIDLDYMTGHNSGLSGWISTVVLFILSLICLLGVYGYSPNSWDWLEAVYEYGLSSIASPFLPFIEIDLIGYGKIKENEKQTNFIKSLSKKRKLNRSPTIEERDFQNDYYEKALAILKEKCTHVPWVEMKWLEWKRKDFSLEDMIKQYAPTCPRCGAILSFIQQNQQYYCYNCQQYFQMS